MTWRSWVVLPVCGTWRAALRRLCSDDGRIRSAVDTGGAMSFTYERRYRGKIQAVLLDWAGTTMDHGCMAPAVVFIEVFKRQGLPISMEEARAPMGAHKRVHIQKISHLQDVSGPWPENHEPAPAQRNPPPHFPPLPP